LLARQHHCLCSSFTEAECSFIEEEDMSSAATLEFASERSDLLTQVSRHCTSS
jgi:hypothetical protein